MRRPIVTTLTLALLVSASPTMAADEDTTTDDAAAQRIEDSALGVSVAVPADWRVNLIEGVRESAVDRDDGTPVMETTVFYANGGDGTWCDADAYLDMPADSSLEAFAFAFVNHMQQNEGPDVAMVVAEEELPIGPAYRVEAFDQATGRIRGLYLFDGPARDDGAFERYLLTCAAREFTEPFWTDVANTIEFSEPVMAEEEAAGEAAAAAEAAEDAAAEEEASGDEAA